MQTQARTLHLTREQNRIARRMLDGEIAAFKNHIVSAVKAKNFEQASKLTAELEQITELCHVFLPDDMYERYASEGR